MKNTDKIIKKRVRRIVVCAFLPVFLVALGIILWEKVIIGDSQKRFLELFGYLFTFLVLGLLSGLSLIVLFGSTDQGFQWILMLGGFGVGLIVGRLSRWHFIKNVVVVQTPN